jgi:hypothetical protein
LTGAVNGPSRPGSARGRQSDSAALNLARRIRSASLNADLGDMSRATGYLWWAYHNTGNRHHAPLAVGRSDVWIRDGPQPQGTPMSSPIHETAFQCHSGDRCSFSTDFSYIGRAFSRLI